MVTPRMTRYRSITHRRLRRAWLSSPADMSPTMRPMYMLNRAGATATGADTPSPLPISGASDTRMPIAYQMGSPVRNART